MKDCVKLVSNCVCHYIKRTTPYFSLQNLHWHQTISEKRPSCYSRSRHVLARFPVLLFYVNPLWSVRWQFILPHLSHRLAIDGASVQLFQVHEREIYHVMTVGIKVIGNRVAVSRSNTGEV